MSVIETLFVTIVVYIILMFSTAWFAPGPKGKVTRSSFTTVAFTIIGLIICSLDYEGSYWLLFGTRAIGGIFLIVAACHGTMIYVMIREGKRPWKG